MTEGDIHVNPFAASGHVTMADVLEQIADDDGLPIQRRRNICSSIRTFARLLSRDLTAMPAHPGFYRGLITRLHPLQCGVSKKRLQNVKSDVLFSLRHLGLGGGRRTYLAPLSEKWQRLFDATDDRQIKYRLSRFMRFCSNSGISPEDVTDDIASDFLAALTEESFVKSPQKIHGAACRNWNHAVKVVNGWPDIRLGVPKRRKTYTFAWASFPVSFQKDADDWLDHLRGNDILSKDEFVRPLRTASIKSRRFAVRQLASALVHQGHDIGEIKSLAFLVSMDHAREALRFFLDRSGDRPTSQIHGLAYTLKRLAEKWVKVTPEHVAQLKELCRRLKRRNRGLTDKNKIRLRQFDDPDNKALLLDFPRRQLEEAQRSNKKPRHRSLKVQTALAVELLLMTPIRIGNLASLDIERHFHWGRAGQNRGVHLVIPAREVKNQQDIEFELPEETVRLLRTYIEDYRPILVDEPNPFLFPGRGGRHKIGTVLSTQIKEHVRDATGLVVNAHLFRHIAAKLYLDANPGGYEVVRRVLGHRSMDTTINFYTGLETAAAARHFDDQILKLRHDLAGGGNGDR